MLAHAIFFYIFAFIAIVSAIMVTVSKNTVHSVFFLILDFISISCLFIMIGAEFLGMIMLIVYVGAVAVLFLFVVMMLNVAQQKNQWFSAKESSKHIPIGLIVSVIIFFELIIVIGGWKYKPDVVAQLIMKYFPDFRRVLNELQKHSVGGMIDDDILTFWNEDLGFPVYFSESETAQVVYFAQVNNSITLSRFSNIVLKNSQEDPFLKIDPQSIITWLLSNKNRKIYFDNKNIGIITAIYPTVWGIGQLFTGKMSDKFSKKSMLFWGMLIQGLAIVWLPFTSNFYALAIISAILGLGTALVYPTFLSTIAQATSPKQRAESIGTFRLWRDLGYAFGALISGITADIFGIQYAIFLIGGLTIISSLVIKFRMPEQIKSIKECIEVEEVNQSFQS